MNKIDDNKELKKVPILTHEELKKLSEIMYSNDGDKLLNERFWNEVYEKRGIEKQD